MDRTTTEQPTTDTTEDHLVVIDLGDAAELTLGQGKGSSEDKRKAYN